MRETSKSAVCPGLLSPVFVPACLGAFVLLRLMIILFVPIEQYSDELWYYNEGVNIASGWGYSEHGIPTAYWPPGWPGFLGVLFSLFGPSPFVGQVANLVFAVITFLLVLRLGSTLYGDKQVGRLAVLILTIYPNQIGYIPTLSTEVFYTALLFFAIFVVICGHRWTRFVLSGVLFGVATLTKAQTLLIPAILFAGWWLSVKGTTRLAPYVGRAVVVYATMAIVIAPWAARNYIVFGEFVPISTNGGATLLTGNNPSAGGDYTADDALVRQVPHDVAGQVANDRMATAVALKWIHDNPAVFLTLIPKKVWRLWAPDGESEWSYQAGFKDYEHYWIVFRTARIINQIYYVILIVFFVISSVYYIRQHRAISPYAATGYILAAYFTAISIVFSGQSRFHFPLMPWVAMCAAWAMIQLARTSDAAERAVA
jgi:hypothetical protein